MQRSSSLALALIALIATSCSKPERDPLRVFAAASTGPALRELCAQFEKQHSMQIELSLASSAVLAQQIEQGAQADVFVSASGDWITYLDVRGCTIPESRAPLLENQLVIVVSDTNPVTIRVAPEFEIETVASRIAVAVESSPLGTYTREALARLGWWARLAEQRVGVPHARAVVASVARGDVELGIAYASDARTTRGVRIAAVIPQAWHNPIEYPVVALLSSGPNAQTAAPKHNHAQEFIHHLRSTTAAQVFAAAGFTPVTPADATPPAPRWAESAEGEAVVLSLWVSAVGVLIALPFGLGFGWLLARRDFFGKALVEGILTLPLVLPPVATGYLLLLLLGPGGWLGGWLDSLGLPIAFHWRGAAIAAAVMGFPLLLRAIRLGIEAVDPDLEDTARTLGASRLDVFRTVTLPLAWPGLLAGMTLAFARALGEFGATITLAGNIEGGTQTLPLALHTFTQQPGGEPPAMRLLVISIVLAIAAIVVSEQLARRHRRRLND